MEILPFLFASTSLIFTLVGVIASIAARTSKESEPRLDKKNVEALEKNTLLTEIQGTLKQQKTIAKLYRIADSSLTFGQYIIGGLLASTFIQQSLSSNIIGFLGIVVLLSSLIREKYKPYVKALAAERRVIVLKALQRDVNHAIFLHQEKAPNAPSIFEIREKVIPRLNELDRTDIPQDVDNSTSATTTLTLN